MCLSLLGSRVLLGILMADLRYIRREPGLHLVDAKDVVVLENHPIGFGIKMDQGMSA